MPSPPIDHAAIDPHYKQTNPVRPPKEGRCQYFMARKQRYCTVMVDNGVMYCHDHQVLVDGAGGIAPQPGDKRERPVVAEAAAVTLAADDQRVPCPYSALHTIRKQNYCQHLTVCPHRPDPSAKYCTVEDCNIVNPSLRTGRARPLFADLPREDKEAFIQWVERTYEELGIAKNELIVPHGMEPSDLECPVSSYVRPSLEAYVSSGREREAVQHVALANIAHLAFFENVDVDSFPAQVVGTRAMSTLAAAQGNAEGTHNVGFMEYGAGKGGLAAAMRMAYPDVCTIVVDRDVFRDMKDAQMLKRGRVGRSDRREQEDRDEAPQPSVMHARLKMNIKDFAVDKCLEGILQGHVATSLSKMMNPFAAPQLPASWIAMGKHLCGGCTDMTLRSVVEAKTTHFGGIMIATCCHHMCSADTYVYPEIFEGGHMTMQQLIDCCCGTAGWGISGKAIDNERRIIGRKVKRLLDFGRVQYLKRVIKPNGKPLFRFVGMIQYTSSAITEENEVLVAIP